MRQIAFIRAGGGGRSSTARGVSRQGRRGDARVPKWNGHLCACGPLLRCSASQRRPLRPPRAIGRGRPPQGQTAPLGDRLRQTPPQPGPRARRRPPGTAAAPRTHAHGRAARRDAAQHAPDPRRCRSPGARTGSAAPKGSHAASPGARAGGRQARKGRHGAAQRRGEAARAVCGTLPADATRAPAATARAASRGERTAPDLQPQGLDRGGVTRSHARVLARSPGRPAPLESRARPLPRGGARARARARTMAVARVPRPHSPLSASSGSRRVPARTAARRSPAPSLWSSLSPLWSDARTRTGQRTADRTTDRARTCTSTGLRPSGLRSVRGCHQTLAALETLGTCWNCLREREYRNMHWFRRT